MYIRFWRAVRRMAMGRCRADKGGKRGTRISSADSAKPIAKEVGTWRFDCAISANDPATTSTPPYHIPSTKPYLPHPRSITRLQEIIIRSSGSEAECILWVRQYIFVLTVKRGCQKLSTKLQEISSDLATGSRERIEGIEIDM